MNLNQFAAGSEPVDMTTGDEFKSLCQSAQDLGLAHDPKVRYTSRNVVARHLRFNVLDWGPLDAPVIFCLHGNHQSAHSWDLVSLSLADRFRVIVPDQRGHGDSEWARDCDYSTDAMAHDAKAILAALNIQRPIVMGHSMGGRNTLVMALSDQAIARALVIVDVGPELSDRGRKVIGSFITANEEFDDLDAFVANVQRYDPYRSREHIERTVKYNLFQRTDGKYISKCDRAPRRLGQTMRSGGDALTLENSAGLDIPVLLIRGETSTILTPEAAQRFADTLPQGQLVTVPNCGHNVHSQNTAGFLDVVSAYLGEHLAEPTTGIS
jgi:pimeloyl-ACP methyl ester carboxylesterase